MLFLLNEEVLDIEDPWASARALQVNKAPPALADVVGMGQMAAFGARGLENAHPDVRRMIASLFWTSGNVNCVLLLCPPEAVSARDVRVRLAYAPWTNMLALWEAQNKGELSPTLINAYVWRLAGGVAAA